MITFIAESVFTGAGRSTMSAHIGEGFVHPRPEAVVEVQADGDELSKVYRDITNIPVSKTANVVRWYGDHAKFIAANIKL